MNWFKQNKPAPKLSPLEAALWDSLQKETGVWEFNMTPDTSVRSIHRGRGATLMSFTEIKCGVMSGKLLFSDEFAQLWAPFVEAEYFRRKHESDEIEARRVEDDLKRRMGL